MEQGQEEELERETVLIKNSDNQKSTFYYHLGFPLDDNGKD